MQALRLLINLSTNEHMIQYLHSANVSKNFEKTTKNPDFEKKKIYLHMIASFFKVYDSILLNKTDDLFVNNGNTR